MPSEANSLVASPLNYTNMGSFRTTKLHSERRVRSAQCESSQLTVFVLVYYLNESLTKCYAA